ncbi:uracil/xanthine transporter [Paenibacillus sp. SYP-B3998]|uniref:Uracil/xanthine transporter n=1 Tax=Paenibacillus sp. SYP-B3998 TaxID=2678564 RepID=A0A6G3ZX54_9BACL|nr:uracil/xanthine transporter [Paenibacillus sp. SYP-B3998]NEW06660.1 uracil/xanthine transporter [Paenibacillus sp. SYP-B3998]
MLTKMSPKIWLAGVQWLFFMFTNTIVVPLSLGHAFQLGPEEIATSLQRSFILTGVLCILQALWGHRYAVMDGPAGIWWGLVLNLCSSAQSVGMSMTEVGGGLASGFLLASLTMIVLGSLGFASFLKKIFTPIVMGVSLFLLTIQLVVNFFKGMLGMNSAGEIDIKVAALSIVIAIFVAMIHLKGSRLISSYSILIGIVVGWIAYELFFPTTHTAQAQAGSMLAVFPWGAPNLQIGIILTSFIVGLINMTNTITCLSTVEKMYQTKTTDAQYKRSYLLTGVFTALSSCFGLLPFGLFTSSIGLLESTKILERRALIIGGGMFALLGLIPALSGLFSSLPSSVGNAVLFVAYLQMFGTALRTIQGIPFNSKTVYRIALPVLLGISIMNTPPQAFSVLPIYLRPLVGNGLAMGVILSLVLEVVVNWRKYELPITPLTASQKPTS